MQLARIAQSMVAIAIVLFALTTYNSPTLAGLATFFSVFPGLLVSPIAGALLDRHGRTRLVTLDYLIALTALMMIGALAYWNALPAWLLIVIAGVASLTAPLSNTGLRSLFPIIIPSHLWERVNAVDSTGYVFAVIVGPPVAASLFALWGGPLTFIIIGLTYGVAALVIARTPDPVTTTVSTGRITSDAWQGLVYTWRNPTLRGLGFSISTINLANGAFTIIVPILVLNQLHYEKTLVGIVIAVQGLTGVMSAFAFGRLDTRDKERMMLALPMFATAATMALLLAKANIVVLVVVMAITGLLNGPIDIALFTLRQRRTDPSWTGRAFAVSMAFNYSGVPIGSAVAGILATQSVGSAVWFCVLTSAVSGMITLFMIPER